MPDANFADYVRSLGEELRARASRVRQLIGEAHWGRDGQHKEELLAEFLGRHLPTRYVALPGFVVSADSFPEGTSREQDIVIWEAQRYPWLMRANHLAIGFPDACAAAISVKTTIDHVQFMDMWNTIGSIPCGQKEFPRVGFVFEESSFPKNIETVYAWFADAIKAAKKVNLNYLATTADVFARVDTAGTEARIRVFSSKGASFGLLLGCLLQDLGDRHFDLTVALDALEATPLGTFQTVSLQ